MHQNYFTRIVFVTLFLKDVALVPYLITVYCAASESIHYVRTLLHKESNCCIGKS